METDFSIGGDEEQLKAFVTEVLETHGLVLEKHFTAVFSEVMNNDKPIEGESCIIAEAGKKIQLGAKRATHYELPDDHDTALTSIGKVYVKVAKKPVAASTGVTSETPPKPSSTAVKPADKKAKPAPPAPEVKDAAKKDAIKAEAPKPKPKVVKKTVGVWGIDLGQCGLKAIRLAEEDGQVVATAFDFVEHPKILSQPDAEPDQLTREALEKFLSRNQIKGDIVAISVPGQSGLARFVKLPPVEEKKIADIVRFEAKQQIPFPLEEVVWDFQKLGAGMVTDGFALDTEIGLFAMKRDMVTKYLTHFKEVNVDVHIVQMAPLALCNYVAFDLLDKTGPSEEESTGKKSCIVALDIGTDSSNLIITDGGRIIWQRPIPLGGNHFTRALTKDLKLTFAKAEHLKRNAMKSPELKKILASIKPVLSDFVSEVQRSLGYFTNTHRDVQIEYMIGLGNAFRLPGLQRFLSEKLQLEVKKIEQLRNCKGPGVVDAPIFTENMLSFAVAYGLAVQGLSKARLLTNLLPSEIRVERLIKAKKPWAVSAAAVLLLSIAALAFGYGKQKEAYAGKPIQEAETRSKAVLQVVQKAENEFKEVKRQAEEQEKGVGSIVSGQKEQINWLHLCQFIDEIVPRPEDAFPVGPDGKPILLGTDGKPLINLQTPDGKPLVNQKDALKFAVPESAQLFLQDAREAFHYEWSPWRAGRPSGAGKAKDDELGDGLDRLLQFNIEAVSCRYSANLADVWNNIPSKLKNVKARDILPTEDITRPPGQNDKGWVIELRGYTFHKDANVFIQSVLMENIAKMGAEKSPNWPINLEPAKSGTSAPPVTTPPGKPPVPGQPPGTGGSSGGVQPGGAQTGKPISHIVLLNSVSKKADASTPFEIIATTKLPSLLTPTPTSPTSGMPGGMPGGGFPPPDMGGMGGAGNPSQAWKPLGSETLGVQTPGQPGFPQPIPVRPGEKPPPVDDKNSPARYIRTEFVIIFIWREPTTADHLLKAKSAPTPAKPNTPPTPPPQPMNPPMTES